MTEILKNLYTRVLNERKEKREKSDVMSLYYDIQSNGHSPQKLDEVTIDRVLNKHAKNGLVIISANRSDNDNETNNHQTRELIADIKASGFSYFPVYGGYRGTDDVIDSFEPSFVVVNYDRNGKESNFEELQQFGIDMCKKYGQDSVLIQAPNQAPNYIDKNGEQVNTTSSKDVIKNDPTQEYFSSLIKTKNIDNENPQRMKRWTYDIRFECFCNPYACTLNEQMRRSKSGEIMFPYNSKKNITNEVRVTNFLREYRPNTTNNAKLVNINELNAKSLINKHSKSGYIVISPCRGYEEFGLDINNPHSKNELAKINNQRIKEIISLIKQSNYSYTPTYGGFIENQGTPQEENVYERSFIIYNHDKKGNEGNMKDLIEFGQELAKKYNQDSFLVKAPNEPPRYVTSNGDIDMEFGDNVSFNDFSETYFTDLHKNTQKYKDEQNRKPTRFTFTECYINPSPQGLSEAHIRYNNNEVFIPYKIK